MTPAVDSSAKGIKTLDKDLRRIALMERALVHTSRPLVSLGVVLDRDGGADGRTARCGRRGRGFGDRRLHGHEHRRQRRREQHGPGGGRQFGDAGRCDRDCRDLRNRRRVPGRGRCGRLRIARDRRAGKRRRPAGIRVGDDGGADGGRTVDQPCDLAGRAGVDYAFHRRWRDGRRRGGGRTVSRQLDDHGTDRGELGDFAGHGRCDGCAVPGGDPPPDHLPRGQDRRRASPC